MSFDKSCEKKSAPVRLRSFLEEWTGLFENVATAESTNKALKEKCSIQHCQHIEDVPCFEFNPGVTESQRLSQIDLGNCQISVDDTIPRTFKAMRHLKNAEKIRRLGNPFIRTVDSFKHVPPPSANTKENAEDLVDFYHDVLVTVRFYRPVRASHAGRSLERPVFAEEFECLGSNYLSELRDKISCICNRKRFFDISENPNQAPLEQMSKKLKDPGFFFIDDTFYNDFRNPKNVDYSETVRTWATGRAVILNRKQYKTAKMESTRFIDLTLSLGRPQVYQHHGNCEHVFVFSQIEMLTPGAVCKHRSQYPHVRSISLFNNRCCHMCGFMHYNYIVEKSDRQLYDPAYLCRNCFLSYHYIDGKKIGNFKAYCITDYDQEQGDALRQAESDGTDESAPNDSSGNSMEFDTEDEVSSADV